MALLKNLWAVGAILALTPLVHAGFNAASQSNIAVYWGNDIDELPLNQDRH
jgi:hypothetical protein